MEHQKGSRKISPRLFNLTLAGLVGQVGCLTFAIVVGAAFLGMWLDGHFQTRPWFTIGLVITSIPISLLLMLIIVRTTVKKIKPEVENQKSTKEESNIGKGT